MLDRIDPRSPVPLYAQISAELRAAIATGELTAGVPLPSVRQLSSQLRVNPATVVQAYRELETEGLVSTRHGAGTFVLEVPLADPHLRPARPRRRRRKSPARR